MIPKLYSRAETGANFLQGELASALLKQMAPTRVTALPDPELPGKKQQPEALSWPTPCPDPDSNGPCLPTDNNACSEGGCETPCKKPFHSTEAEGAA